MAEKAEAIERRDTAVIPVLPDSYEKASDWQSEFDLPFPLLADPNGEVGDAYDQPRRFGLLGQLHDVIGRMPKAVVLDLRDDPEIVEAVDGNTPGDRPALEDLLSPIDDLREEFVFDCELVEC